MTLFTDVARLSNAFLTLIRVVTCYIELVASKRLLFNRERKLFQPQKRSSKLPEHIQFFCSLLGLPIILVTYLGWFTGEVFSGESEQYSRQTADKVHTDLVCVPDGKDIYIRTAAIAPNSHNIVRQVSSGDGLSFYGSRDADKSNWFHITVIRDHQLGKDVVGDWYISWWEVVCETNK